MLNRNENESVLTREELYELVWSTPLRKLATTYGISDVGLAKVCDRHNIPRPVLGHWSKLMHGHEVERPELPVIDAEDRNEIRLFRRQFEGNTKTPIEVPRIEVADRLQRAHPVVTKVRNQLSDGRKGEGGVIYPNEKANSVSATKKTLPRALRILDALCKYWQGSIGEVTLDPNGVVFACDQDDVIITLTEKVARKQKEGDHPYWDRYRFEATGLLSIGVTSCAFGLRSKWADGKVQRVENILGKVVLGLQALIEQARCRRLDNECEARQKGLAEKTRAAINQRAEAEVQRRKQLHQAANDWETARKVRQYLEALAARVDDVGATNADNFERWLKWAHWYADSLCPLAPTRPQPEIFDEIRSENTPVSELDLTRAQLGN